MSEPKPFASLSSGLLARKGAARPAMRPQGFGQGGAALEDLGWNDMGFEAPKPADAPRDGEHDAFGEDIAEHPRALHKSGLTPVDSPVHGQQAEIADRFGKAAEPEQDEDVVELDAAEPVEAEPEAGGDEDYDETAELYEPELPAAQPEPEAEVAESAPAASLKKMAIVFADDPVEDVVEAPAAEDAEVEPAVAVSVAASPAPRRMTKSRSAPGAKGKAAFTLRLDQSRHLKLRLACAVHGRSAQMIVTEALDRLLEAMPELDAMADKAPRKGS